MLTIRITGHRIALNSADITVSLWFNMVLNVSIVLEIMYRRAGVSSSAYCEVCTKRSSFYISNAVAKVEHFSKACKKNVEHA